MKGNPPKDINSYIRNFPADVQWRLNKIRATIVKIAPEAVETISYGIPTFNLNGTYLIYFAAYKKHIGIYPVPSKPGQIDEAFADYYTSGKGTLQLPLDKPIPLKLISKLVKYRVKQTELKGHLS